MKTVAFLCLFLWMGEDKGYAAPGQGHIDIAVPIISQLVKSDADGHWVGQLVDLLKRAEKEIGVPFHLRMVPFKRAALMVAEGGADFGIFMESPKRNETGMPIVKLGDANFVIVSLKDKPIRNLSDLKNKTVARIRGGTEIKSLKGVPGLKYYYFNNHDAGTRLLQYGRVDALVTPDFRLWDVLKKGVVNAAELAEPVSIEARELWLYWSWKSNLDFSLIRRLKRMPDLYLNVFDPVEVKSE